MYQRYKCIKNKSPEYKKQEVFSTKKNTSFLLTLEGQGDNSALTHLLNPSKTLLINSNIKMSNTIYARKP
jgi:hypothetical protein